MCRGLALARKLLCCARAPRPAPAAHPLLRLPQGTSYFLFFLIVFIGLTLFVCYQSYELFRRSADPALRRMFWVGQSVWLLAFFAFWVPDKLMCERVQPFNLHALFHLLVSVAPWWYLTHSVHCFYTAALARRTGRIADHASGALVPMPQALRLFLRRLDADWASVSGSGPASPPGSDDASPRTPGTPWPATPAAAAAHTDTVLEIPHLRAVGTDPAASPVLVLPYVALVRRRERDLT